MTQKKKWARDLNKTFTKEGIQIVSLCMNRKMQIKSIRNIIIYQPLWLKFLTYQVGKKNDENFHRLPMI